MPSYEQNITIMNKLIPALATLLATTMAHAQSDTTESHTRTETTIVTDTRTDTIPAASTHALVVDYVPGKGMRIDMLDTDTTKKGSPLVINTKRKKITISTEGKPWITKEDSVKDVLRGLRRERRNQFTYWSGIDIGANALLGPDGSGDFPKEYDFLQLDQGRSRFVSINFMEQKIEFGSHHVGLLTGLGWEFTNYRFKENSIMHFQGDTITATPMDAPQFIKSKLRQGGFRVPLMLEFNTKRAKMPTADEIRAAARDTSVHSLPKTPFSFTNKKNFHLAVGVVGSWYYDSMYKQKYRMDGQIRKDVDKGDHRLLPYRLAASARIGYGSLNLFAEYALTPLFKDGVMPELTPLNVGLTIVGFN
ncbi:MAG: hypothetical protein KF797_03320 [Flavobacteriales bacterium]|nr:hypothetical protein [Flavobacteriales bacterium]